MRSVPMWVCMAWLLPTMAFAAEPAYRIVADGENAPESIVRIVKLGATAAGQVQADVAVGPCLEDSDRPLQIRIETADPPAVGALYFRVPDDGAAEGFALRLATAEEAAQYRTCDWR